MGTGWRQGLVLVPPTMTVSEMGRRGQGMANLAACRIRFWSGPQNGWEGVPVIETFLCPLLRWGQLEALKKEKGLQLARSMEVCSFLQEYGHTQAQLQDMLLRLEALEPESSETSHCALQLTQQKVLVLEKRVHYLQRVAVKYDW